jgi:hypothetical protein
MLRRCALLALVLLLTATATATARDRGISGGLSTTGKHVLVTFTCDAWVDMETGDVIRERCYASLNRYCDKRTWRCGKIAPWTRGTRSPARAYR